MARIKDLIRDPPRNPSTMDSIKVGLENFSLRMSPEWRELLKKKAAKLSAERKLKINEADLIREAVFQCWIRDSQKK